MANISGTISATGSSNAVTLTLSSLPPDNAANGVVIGLSGTFAGFTVQVEVQGLDQKWYGVACVDTGTMAVNNGGTAISLTDNTNKQLYVQVPAYLQGMAVRIYAAARSSGTLAVQMNSGNWVDAPVIGVNVSSMSQLTGALTVTSSSANALDVGPNGVTNPTFQVDASTASAATGIKVKSAAAAGGVAISVVSSGTNENLKFDAKGAGSMQIGGVSTGQVSIGRGSVAPPITSNTITSLGTAQSTTPTAAQVCGGVMTQTGSTGAGTATLPTGTQIETQLTANSALALADGDTFEATYAVLGGGQTVTITSATGLTLVGTVAIGSGKVGTLKFIRTGANTFTVYCTVSA